MMAAEIFTTRRSDFRIPGLGSYLKEAANKGNLTDVILEVVTLIFVIVVLDQLVCSRY